MKERGLLYFALGVLTVVAIGGANAVSLRNDGIGFPDGSVQTTAAGSSRTVYLTGAFFQGSAALTACTEPDFHMASLWEIRDPSRLIYGKTIATAETGVDLGDGLPAGLPGWIRTGSLSNSVTLTPGTANCDLWSVTSGAGTLAQLHSAWPDMSGGGEVPGWFFRLDDCSDLRRVWCAED